MMSPHPEPRLQTLSPEFVPRPGWGGQLRDWFFRRPAANTLRVLLICILAIGFVSVIRNGSDAPSEVVRETPLVSAPTGYTVLAEPGQGLANLAELALGSFLVAHPDTQPLAPEQQLFVIDTLTRTIISISSEMPFQLNPGDDIFFAEHIIEQAVWAAQELTDAQREAWSKQLR